MAASVPQRVHLSVLFHVITYANWFLIPWVPWGLRGVEGGGREVCWACMGSGGSWSGVKNVLQTGVLFINPGQNFLKTLKSTADKLQTDFVMTSL